MTEPLDLAEAARRVNDVGYGYMSSWALLTASRRRLFDRLPATAAELTDEYPDADLVTTWLHVLAAVGLVRLDGARWSLVEPMDRLLVGDGSYADYLGHQVARQLAPRLMGGPGSGDELARVLLDPGSRRGYEGWFEDAAEAEAYQSSQYAGSLLPGRTMARSLSPRGPVLDVGGGWGAVARAVAERHDVDVDVVDLAPVVTSAPSAGERVRFRAGSALDPATWPDGPHDGAILSYLLSSVPGSFHVPVLEALAERGVRWIAVHGFLLGGGRHAAAWSLQHAVFVPGHRSRSVDEVADVLVGLGYTDTTSLPIVDEMTTMVVATRRDA